MSNKNVSDPEIQRIKQGLTDLGEAIFQLARAEAPEPVINDRSLNGDKIMGGTITKFASTGIRDDSTRLVVVVDDNGILTDNIDVETIVGDTTVSGNLTVEGTVHARKLHVDELTADIRQERTSSLEFVEGKGNPIANKGLLWRTDDKTSQFVFRPGPDRVWSSNPIDLHDQAYYAIDNISVLSMNELGSTVTRSNLTQVGVLQNLEIEGNMNIDQYVFWNGDYMRLGIGTETPNGTFGIVQDDAEFIIDTEGKKATVGTYTTTDLNIITDNSVRISVTATGKIIIGSDSNSKTNIKGKLGVNINNPTADIETAGPVSFEGKRFEVSASAPTSGSYRLGDIVWNSQPRPTGFVGWICTKEGTPGIWKTFGPISS
jgi:hypothetical protein